jgi:protein PhnA
MKSEMLLNPGFSIIPPDANQDYAIPFKSRYVMILWRKGLQHFLQNLFNAKCTPIIFSMRGQVNACITNSYFRPMNEISQALTNRSSGQCELCNGQEAIHGYTVAPKKDDQPQNQVALCGTCYNDLDNLNDVNHWRCLEGSIWSQEPSVQALSRRLLARLSAQPWALDALNAVELSDEVQEWASYSSMAPGKHMDGFGNELNTGDNVVLTQALDVKGSNFTASKGTVVKRIRLVPDNPEQIEGKINEQLIVILTKYVKKN